MRVERDVGPGTATVTVDDDGIPFSHAIVQTGFDDSEGPQQQQPESAACDEGMRIAQWAARGKATLAATNANPMARWKETLLI